MNKLKRTMVLLSCVSLLARPGVSRAALTNMTDEYQTEDYTVGTIVLTEKEVFSNVSRLAGNGYVNADGVRLRVRASSSSSVLELMYQYEKVLINDSKSNTKWYYLERLKTGTWGYAARDCIYVC